MSYIDVHACTMRVRHALVCHLDISSPGQGNILTLRTVEKDHLQKGKSCSKSEIVLPSSFTVFNLKLNITHKFMTLGKSNKPDHFLINSDMRVVVACFAKIF